MKLKPYKLNEKVLIDVQQIFPLPEAEDYQIKIREKEREERKTRTQSRDMSRYNLHIGELVYQNLPKRQLAFYVVKAAFDAGNNPLDIISSTARWIIMNGELDEKTVLSRGELPENRAPESSSSEIARFFTNDSELFHYKGKTYALTKMWGIDTAETVENIIKRYDLNNIGYEIVSK